MNGVFKIIMSISSFGIGDLSGKYLNIQSVLEILHKKKIFSTFEASANDKIAHIMTSVFSQGLVKDIGGDYPYTNVELTEKGLSMIGVNKLN